MDHTTYVFAEGRDQNHNFDLQRQQNRALMDAIGAYPALDLDLYNTRRDDPIMPASEDTITKTPQRPLGYEPKPATVKAGSAEYIKG
jgi:hypothetical protein